MASCDEHIFRKDDELINLLFHELWLFAWKIKTNQFLQMNCDTNPLEAGLDYFIKLNKVAMSLETTKKTCFIFRASFV